MFIPLTHPHPEGTPTSVHLPSGEAGRRGEPGAPGPAEPHRFQSVNVDDDRLSALELRLVEVERKL
jgi:hypothetical protein